MKKNIWTIFAAALMTVLVTSCASDEDTTPSNLDVNMFAPADANTGETAQLQRNFYKKVGCYLIFNDTLVKEQRGVDSYGNPLYYTEVVDLGYKMTGSSDSYVYTFKYLTNYDEQKDAAEIIENKLAPTLGKALPYSFLLVDSITMWTWSNGILKPVKKSSYNGTDPHPALVLGSRCYAVSLNGGDFLSDPDTYVSKIVQKVIVDRLSRLIDNDMASFYAFSSDYYAQDETSSGLTTDYEEDSVMWKYGFFTDIYGDYFPYKSDDLEAWEKKVATYSLSDFQAEYGSSELMMKKFKTIRAIVESLGIKLDD